MQSGYGSSEISITIVQWAGKLEVVYSGSFERILYPDAVKLLSELITKYHLCKVFLIVHYVKISNTTMEKWLTTIY